MSGAVLLGIIIGAGLLLFLAGSAALIAAINWSRNPYRRNHGKRRK